MKTKKFILAFFIFIATTMLYALVKPAYASTAGIGKVDITDERKVEMPIKSNVQPASIEQTPQGTIQKYTVKHQMFSSDPTKKMNIWKLIGVDEVKDGEEPLTDLYCIRAGLGFINQQGGEQYNPEPVDYTIGYELPKDFETANQFFEKSKNDQNKVPVFTDESKDNYNKMMWILDHMLLEDAPDDEARAYLVKHAGYTDETFSESNFRENVLTRADIEVIQQLAIWYYTNADEEVYHDNVYQGNTLQPLCLCLDQEIYTTSGAFKSLTDIYDVGTALIPGNGHSCGSERQGAANKLFKYLIEGYEKENGAARLNEQGLYVPTREIIVYVAGENTNQQPVVQVKETAEADIALRKFIYSVRQGEEGEEQILTGNSSREPQVDTSKLNDMDSEGNKITTATYNHPKTPVRVQIGDTVTYTIRLYNEGEIPAKIKKVKDTLPEYIQFADPDTNGYWQCEDNGIVATTTDACKIVGAGRKIKL